MGKGRKVFEKFFFLFFLGLHLQHMDVPGLGVKSELQWRPVPQPQHCKIQATSAIHATACGNAASLTHWARSGIKPESSQTLCQALNTRSHNGNSLKWCLYKNFHNWDHRKKIWNTYSLRMTWFSNLQVQLAKFYFSYSGFTYKGFDFSVVYWNDLLLSMHYFTVFISVWQPNNNLFRVTREIYEVIS